jgi:hypothetical protein
MLRTDEHTVLDRDANLNSTFGERIPQQAATIDEHQMFAHKRDLCSRAFLP